MLTQYPATYYEGHIESGTTDILYPRTILEWRQIQDDFSVTERFQLEKQSSEIISFSVKKIYVTLNVSHVSKELCSHMRSSDKVEIIFATLHGPSRIPNEERAKKEVSHSQTLGGELLRSKEEGGKSSSQCFIKYLSSLIMLKMYRKCTNAPFAPFLMLRNVKTLFSLSMTPKISIEREISSSF